MTPALPAALGLALLAAGPALAAGAVVRACSDLDTIEMLAEPWEDNTTTFANGAVRLAVIDRGEPAAAAMQLLILSPPLNEAGLRRCQVVTLDPQDGFGAIDFAGRGTAYDAARGLIVDMPVQVFDPGVGGFLTRQLTLTIRQDTGAVGAELVR